MRTGCVRTVPETVRRVYSRPSVFKGYLNVQCPVSTLLTLTSDGTCGVAQSLEATVPATECAPAQLVQTPDSRTGRRGASYRRHSPRRDHCSNRGRRLVEAKCTRGFAHFISPSTPVRRLHRVTLRTNSFTFFKYPAQGRSQRLTFLASWGSRDTKACM